MSSRFRRLSVLAGWIAFAAVATGQADDQVPGWFRTNPDKPQAIFEAWQQLTTREAMLCLGENWQVLAGRVFDDRGAPLARTPIELHLSTHIRSYSAPLQTDDNGHFIIYAPYSPTLGPKDRAAGDLALNGCFLLAAPGFPNTPLGRAFAAKRGAFRACDQNLLMREGERAYYSLTCKSDTLFDAAEFAAFEREYATRKPEPRKPWRDRPKDPEGKPGERIVWHYELRVVNDAGEPIAEALVKYQFAAVEPGCWQIRSTDVDGRCRLEEWLLPRQAAGDEQPDDYISRRITVDAPGYGVGPVQLKLKPDEVNTITVAKPAAVAGRVIDHAGRPLPSGLRVQYRRPAWLAFETDLRTDATGAFRFDRIMPGEEFCLVTDGFNLMWRQRASTHSQWFTLKAGELHEGVELAVPLAAGLRGTVETPGGLPVDIAGHHSLWLDYGPDGGTLHYKGTDNGPWGPKDGGRFGFFGLGSKPFHFRTSVPGYEVEPTGPIRLEPGELRFVRLILRPAPGK